METAMRNVSINDRNTPSMSPIIKSEPLNQDQPLDFSTKVRVHSIDSEEAVRKVSNDSAIVCDDEDNTENSPSTTPAASDRTDADRRRPLVGEPRVSMPMPNINSFLPPTSMAGMGMFYPGAPVFPNFMPPGFSGQMWPNPMAAMMQQQQEAARKLIQQAQSHNKQNSNLRPLFGKHFMGKDMLGMPGVGRPFPGMPGFPNPGMPAGGMSSVPDPSILAEALKSHEEMFNAYKQQVLSQKAQDEAKRGARRQPAATVTNGNHSTSTNNGTISSSSHSAAESTHLSQITEQSPPTSPNQPHTSNEAKSNSNHDNQDNRDSPSSSSSSEEDKHSGSSERMATEPPLPVPFANGQAFPFTNGQSKQISNGKTIPHSNGQSLTSSDESLQTSEGRRSLTPAHSSCGELNDITGMRPRSMTLPTQSDTRLQSYSPSPSVVSQGNASSGPGTPNSKNNDRGFRKRAQTLPDDQKHGKKRDDAYWERRRKNNEAAKRSRDSRRAKEDEIAIRAAFLEQENIRLRIELASLKTETAKLRSELVTFQGPDDHGGPAEGS